MRMSVVGHLWGAPQGNTPKPGMCITADEMSEAFSRRIPYSRIKLLKPKSLATAPSLLLLRWLQHPPLYCVGGVETILNNCLPYLLICYITQMQERV